MQADGISEEAAWAALGVSLEDEPAPRSRRAVRTEQSTVKALRATVRSIDAGRRRLDLEVRRRDELVCHLRAAGWSWDRLATEVGVSRQALHKRVSVKNP